MWSWQRVMPTDNQPSKDDRLRAKGFRIHARPRNGEPVWERKGNLYVQSLALKIIYCAAVMTNSASKVG